MTVSVSFDRNIGDHLWRWSTYFSRNIGIFRPKFSVPFLTNRFFALIREFGRIIGNDKSHFYWLAQFNRKMSFHFPQVFPLISDRSVWHNGKHPKTPFSTQIKVKKNLTIRPPYLAFSILIIEPPMGSHHPLCSSVPVLTILLRCFFIKVYGI